MNVMTDIKKKVKDCYVKWRTGYDENIGKLNWGEVEDEALELASKHSEAVLRVAANMAACYNRSLIKNEKEKPKITVNNDDDFTPPKSYA